MSSPKVAAIITCFHPKTEDLTRLIRSILNQVDKIFLIDNGGFSPSASPEFSGPKIETISANGNLGTAGGYNLGTSHAWKHGFSHVLLLDQDSECANMMVTALLDLETFLASLNLKVAVVGPYYICKSNNEPAPFIRHSGYRIERIYENATSLPLTTQNQKYTECSYVISSGSLISKDSWIDIGNTNDGLFLDFTDIEWGLRANAKGYKCYGSFAAKMYHLIGDEQAHILGRKISLHSPLRHYYAFRNCVWLFQQTFVPFGTRTNYLIKLLPKIVIYSVFSGEPIKQFRFMLRGIWDGISGKLGAYKK